MSNISVAEILKIYGKWIKSAEFVDLISQKLNITEKHAYNKIKEATENGEILKVTLPNRTVIYGLAEFGEPKFEEKQVETVIPFEQTFKEWFLKKLEEVIELNSDGFSEFAFRKAVHLYAVLPEQARSKIKNDVSKIVEDVNQNKIGTFEATLLLINIMTKSLFK
jgi:hypothetical protein